MCTFQELSSGCMLCWEVIPIKIPTTRKGLCGWFLMSAMCVATSMPVFYSPFTHPTSPRMLSLFLPSTSSQIAPSPKGKADPITVLLKTLQWQPFSLRVKSSGHSSPTFPLTQWVPTALPTHCSSNTTRTFLPLCPGSTFLHQKHPPSPNIHKPRFLTSCSNYHCIWVAYLAWPM